MNKFLILAVFAFAPGITAMQQPLATRHITSIINNSGKDVSIRIVPAIMSSSFFAYVPEAIKSEATPLETYTEGKGLTYSVPATPAIQTVDIPANPDGDDIIDVYIDGVEVGSFATSDLPDRDYTITINTQRAVTIS
jgi:hypothetical protein